PSTVVETRTATLLRCTSHTAGLASGGVGGGCCGVGPPSLETWPIRVRTSRPRAHQRRRRGLPVIQAVQAALAPQSPGDVQAPPFTAVVGSLSSARCCW